MIPVHAFALCAITTDIAVIETIGSIFIFYPLAWLSEIIFICRMHDHRNEFLSHRIFSLQNAVLRYIIPRTLGHSLMVEHRTLTPLVLVRIQLPQPEFQNLPIGASFCLFSNTYKKFESLFFKNSYFVATFELFML